MNRALVLAVGTAAVAVLAAGCGDSSPSTAPTPTPTGAPAPTGTGTAASLKTAATPLGTIVTDGSGDTLYVFAADTGTSSTCYNACAAEWPPVLTAGTATGTGLTASLIGSSVRTDQTTQVTYNGHPLYRFSADTASGQTNGQGVDAFGGKWYVVSPGGAPITTTPSATTSTSAGPGY